MLKVDLAVIGGGPAGLAAALEARKNGIEKVLILERDKELGRSEERRVGKECSSAFITGLASIILARN